MWMTLLDIWIPLGLHRDQSKYLGWLWNNNSHNSINVLSGNVTHNLIFIASTYVRADQCIMDSFQLQCTQHGLVTITLHITRLINNRVMWKTNRNSILVLRLMPSTVTILSKKHFGEPELWLLTSGETMGMVLLILPQRPHTFSRLLCLKLFKKESL